VFIPAINQMGPSGWDMVRVAHTIRAKAAADGNKVRV
jgi:hypothetical protein